MQRLREIIARDVPFFVATGSAIVGLVLLGASRALEVTDPWRSDLLQNLGSNLVFVFFALGFIEYLVKESERRIDQAERRREAELQRSIDRAERRIEVERMEAERRFEQVRIEAERQFEQARIEAERRREEERWEPVREHVDHYVLNLARRCALAYRIGVGIGDHHLPHAQLRSDGVEGLQGTQEWIEGTIIPRLPRLARLSRSGWQELLGILDEADQGAERVIRQFGDRLKPETFAAILEIQRAIQRAKHSYELSAPVLGVPDEGVEITEQDHAFDWMRLGEEKHGKSRLEVIHTMRGLAERDAADLGKAILRDAINLIGLAIPDFTTERTPTLDGDHDTEDDDS